MIENAVNGRELSHGRALPRAKERDRTYLIEKPHQPEVR